MSEYWEEIHTRGLQSCAVWEEHNDAFQVGQLTLTVHAADVATIMTLVEARDAKEDLYEQAMDLRDQNYTFIQGLNTRAAGVIGGNFEEGDLLQGELDDITRMRNDGTGAVLARGRKVHILWVKVNAARAAAEPALDPIQVGDALAVSLDAAIGAHENLLKAVEAALSVWNTSKSLLRKHALKVDKNNKRWFEAWDSFYPVGSVEHDALSQVDTGPGAVEAPGAVTFSVMYDAVNHWFHIDATADHALNFRVFRKGPGDDDFVPRGSARSSPIQDPVTLSGEYKIKLQAVNSTDDGPMSAEFTITVP